MDRLSITERTPTIEAVKVAMSDGVPDSSTSKAVSIMAG